MFIVPKQYIAGRLKEIINLFLNLCRIILHEEIHGQYEVLNGSLASLSFTWHLLSVGLAPIMGTHEWSVFEKWALQPVGSPAGHSAMACAKQ